MTFSAHASRLLSQLLIELGLRPPRQGRVTFHFSKGGRAEGVEENRYTPLLHESVAPKDGQEHTDGH